MAIAFGSILPTPGFKPIEVTAGEDLHVFGVV
jgi:hypothetical protein